MNSVFTILGCEEYRSDTTVMTSASPSEPPIGFYRFAMARVVGLNQTPADE